MEMLMKAFEQSFSDLLAKANDKSSGLFKSLKEEMDNQIGERMQNHEGRLLKIEEKILNRVRKEEMSDGRKSFVFEMPQDQPCEIHYTHQGNAQLVKYKDGVFSGDVESGKFEDGKLEVVLQYDADEKTNVILEYKVDSYDQQIAALHKKIEELQKENKAQEKANNKLNEKLKMIAEIILEE